MGNSLPRSLDHTGTSFDSPFDSSRVRNTSLFAYWRGVLRRIYCLAHTSVSPRKLSDLQSTVKGDIATEPSIKARASDLERLESPPSQRMEPRQRRVLGRALSDIKRVASELHAELGE